MRFVGCKHNHLAVYTNERGHTDLKEVVKNSENETVKKLATGAYFLNKDGEEPEALFTGDNQTPLQILNDLCKDPGVEKVLFF